MLLLQEAPRRIWVNPAQVTRVDANGADGADIFLVGSGAALTVHVPAEQVVAKLANI